MMRALAEYEGLLDQFQTDESRILETFFRPDPHAFCGVAESEGEPVAYAVWFYSYSTFLGRHGIYLEDLFVLPQFRGDGIGASLLRSLAERCVREKLGRLEWSVLNWNEPSIGFYRSLGAEPLIGWTNFRLTGDALERLGGASHGR